MSSGPLILNSPFAAPTRHTTFTADGAPGSIAAGRRPSDIVLVEHLRGQVRKWRQGGYRHVERRTRHLLEHWRREDRERRLFFCQIEAVETAIYLFEAAHRLGDHAALSRLDAARAAHGEILPRVAFKLATGSGKTVIMAMLIAWQGLNKLASPESDRFASNFLVVTPGLTIKDRLRVLLPEDPDNEVGALDLVPPDLRGALGQLRIVITNYHAFQRRDTLAAPRLTREILKRPGAPSALQETPAAVVRRVCADLDPRGGLVVLNDEAHHCYKSRPGGERLTGDERREAEAREAEARVWSAGLEQVAQHFGRRGGEEGSPVRAVFDLSATPFFLRGSGYAEGTLFPWVVADFSLVDAIESGVVKVPRVPASGDALWPRVRDALPKRRGEKDSEAEDPVLPGALEEAIARLYGSYAPLFHAWEATRGPLRASTPPVFIVVCNNTAVSRLVYRALAGHERPGPDGATALVPGRFPIFSNVAEGRWLPRPHTILVDSAELKDGGDDPLRAVMNTVGKPGRPGEGVRCVVSVSMLTEGWDTRTVTHILGVRAFTTQLLCEQVIGRGLRRMSYEADEDGMFAPEYAEVHGVPFRFIPVSGVTQTAPEEKPRTRVRALPARAARRICFPRVIGYCFDVPAERLEARFGEEAKMVLRLKGAEACALADLRGRRAQEIAFQLAKQVLDRHHRDGEGNLKSWLFPEVLRVVRRWLDACVELEGGAFPQLLLSALHEAEAVDKIHRAIVAACDGRPRLFPVLSPERPALTTEGVDFTTARPVYPTREDKCHVSHAIVNGAGEQALIQALEAMEEVVAYVKNDHVGFAIPYTQGGVERRYAPDFIARVEHRRRGSLHVILELVGPPEDDRAAAIEAARALWVPAVNNQGAYGRWAFVEVMDLGDVQRTIREGLDGDAASCFFSG